LTIAEALRGVVAGVRKHDADSARQMVKAGSSIASNVAEGSRRVGRDRLHFVRIAAGSAEGTRAHLRGAVAWGYLQPSDITGALQLIDRELALLWGLTR